jgi:hypothetical protein
MVSGKCIGNSFERRVADLFSKGLGGEWVRTPSSGGFIGGANRKRLATLGQEQARLFDADIIPPDQYKNVVIECKKRANINFRQFTEINGSKVINEWLNQLFQNYVASEKKIHFLIFAEKFSPIFVCYQSDLIQQFYKFNDLLNCWYIPQTNHIEYYSSVKTINSDYPEKFIIHELTEDWLKQIQSKISLVPIKSTLEDDTTCSQKIG